MAQSVERRIGSAEVTGSIPVTSFIKKRNFSHEVPFFLIYYFLDNFPRIRCSALSTAFSVFPSFSAIVS